ncbi:MAG: monovalent cation:proton antiporter-2 (CPA2) family protein [Rhodobacteraceae bacterium]|nr:monovalent cation:proton antiporter-2 (CPA2) family protein [Paracoccaceae bacterium]
MESFLFQAMIYLAAAVAAVPLAARLGLGSVLGYLLAGLIIGPVLGLVGDETHNLQHFAEFGVVMMLFLIGLELDPRALWAMRHKLLGLGGLQVVTAAAAVMGAGMLVGLSWSVALAIGLALSLSSTAIVLQTLTEKSLMQTAGGRSAFSVLLTQDIAVIPMLALLPLLAVSGTTEPVEAAAAHGAAASAPAMGMIEDARSLIEALPAWGVTLLTLGAVAGIILAGIYLTRPIFSYIHASRLREMFTALALLIVVAIACLMLVLGLSPALGTFLAGVVLANSEFRHEMESDLEPFKGLLLGLFFITVGAGIDVGAFMQHPARFLFLTLLLMAVKGLLLFILATAFRLRGRDRWLFTLGLAQAGEFAFVLGGFMLQREVIPPELGQTLFLIVALSMLLTPLFFILYEILARRMRTETPAQTADEIEEKGPIIIAGIGRFGQVVNRMIQMAGFHATVLDHDLASIRLMRQFGVNGFLGDPTRPELLHAAGLARAKTLVVALDDKQAALKLVRYARKERPDLHIVARAHDRVHVFELFQAGADDIVREMFDSSLRAGRYVLENLGLSEFEAAELQRIFYNLDRKSMRELAEVWKPGVPVTENAAYMARAIELNRQLETALVAELDEPERISADARPSDGPGRDPTDLR